MNGWRAATLLDLALLQRGFDITKAQQRSGPIPVVSSSGVSSYHDDAKVEAPGVVIGRKGTLGTVFFLNEPFWPHDTTLWVKDFKGNIPKYVFYFLKTMALQQFDVGAANPSLNRNHIHGLPIRIPPIALQKRISDILSAYDDLIENNTKRIKILEEMARSLYREWFVEFRFPGHKNKRNIESDSGKVPTGWSTTTLGALASLISRGVAPTYHDDGPELVINQKCIRDQRLSLEPARRHRTKVPAEKYVRQFDVLLNSTGVGTLGRVTQVMMELERCTVDTHVTIVRPGVNVHPHFFGHALLAKESHFEAQGIGATGQTELARGRIGETLLIVPPRELQARFDEMVAPWRNAADLLLKKQYTLRTTRDLLLPRLLSGEIELHP